MTPMCCPPALAAPLAPGPHAGRRSPAEGHVRPQHAQHPRPTAQGRSPDSGGAGPNGPSAALGRCSGPEHSRPQPRLAEESMVPSEQIAILADHASRWYTAHLLLFAGMMLFIPGLLALTTSQAHVSQPSAMRHVSLSWWGRQPSPRSLWPRCWSAALCWTARTRLRTNPNRQDGRGEVPFLSAHWRESAVYRRVRDGGPVAASETSGADEPETIRPRSVRPYCPFWARAEGHRR
jgi:hypothetical protein